MNTAPQPLRGSCEVDFDVLPPPDWVAVGLRSRDTHEADRCLAVLDASTYVERALKIGVEGSIRSRMPLRELLDEARARRMIQVSGPAVDRAVKLRNRMAHEAYRLNLQDAQESVRVFHALFSQLHAASAHNGMLSQQFERWRRAGGRFELSETSPASPPSTDPDIVAQEAYRAQVALAFLRTAHRYVTGECMSWLPNLLHCIPEEQWSNICRRAKFTPPCHLEVSTVYDVVNAINQAKTGAPPLIWRPRSLPQDQFKLVPSPELPPRGSSPWRARVGVLTLTILVCSIAGFLMWMNPLATDSTPSPVQVSRSLPGSTPSNQHKDEYSKIQKEKFSRETSTKAIFVTLKNNMCADGLSKSGRRSLRCNDI